MTCNHRLGQAALTIALAASLLAPAADAQQALRPKLEGNALVAALAGGGYVLLMRHASTEHVAPDPEVFDLRDCATQRNLSAQGRREAEGMGRAFAKLDIPVGEVMASPYCRCLETGRLAFGKAAENETLSVWDDLTVTERSERGGEIRRMLDTPPPAGTNTVLITHTGALLYSFGLATRPEGLVHVFRPVEGGPAEYVGMLTPPDWVRLAGLEPKP
jgi:phosphohistidine phosphatase SixA